VTRDEYLRRVDYWLRDLPWGTRRDLLAEIRGHLDELPPNTDLRARLGTAEDYAAELRSAAGLERGRGVIAFLRARRPRTLILVVVALTVIGLAIGAVAWIDSYQPLAFAGGSYQPLGEKEVRGVSGAAVVFHNGRSFRYGFTVVNNGRFTVRLLGVPYPPYLPFTARLLTNGPSNPRDFMSGPYRRFVPFDLRPGEMTLLLLRGVYACHSGTRPGPAISIDELPVRFSFLWRTTTIQIPLDGSLTFVFRKYCEPPAVKP
jgi:HAAS domain-containing protein